LWIKPRYPYAIGILERLGTGNLWGQAWQKQFKEEFRTSGYILENETFFNIENEELGQIVWSPKANNESAKKTILGQYCLISSEYALSHSQWAKDYEFKLQEYHSGGYTRNLIGFFCFSASLESHTLINQIICSARGYIIYWNNNINEVLYFSPLTRKKIEMNTVYSKFKKTFTSIRITPPADKTIGLLSSIYNLSGQPYSSYSQQLISQLQSGESGLQVQTICLWVLSYKLYFIKQLHQTIFLD